MNGNPMFTPPGGNNGVDPQTEAAVKSVGFPGS